MKFRLSISILYTSILLVFCTSCIENRAVRIIKKSIAAHGGEEAWNNLESFSLEKETKLYLENGEVENHILQEIEFRQKPFFEAKMTWVKDSITHRVVFDGSKTKYWMGENEIQNEGFLANKKKEIDAAYYVLTKPFDLLDKSKNLIYRGTTKLSDGREAETVQVIDGNPDNPAVDIWWYFFDKKSFQIIAYKVKTRDHTGMIYNLDWDDSSGILFPTSRESFRVDSVGNNLYLRAQYQFKNFSFN